MKMTSRWKSGLAVLVAAGTVFGTAAVSDVANALPAGTPPAQPSGGLALSPSSGTFATPMAIQFSPGNQTCPGDNFTGWAYSPYLTAETPAEIPRIAFNAGGSPVTLNAGVRTSAWRDAVLTGTLVRGIYPSAIGTPGTDTAYVNNINNLSWNNSFSASPLAPGEYTIGVACYNGDPRTVGGVAVPALETARYWTVPVTVTATGYIQGWAPDAPTNITATPGANGTGELAVSWTASTGASGYDVLATPRGTGGVTVGPIAATGTSANLAGLTAGKVYDVQVRAKAGALIGDYSPAVEAVIAPTDPADSGNDITGDVRQGESVELTFPVAGTDPVEIYFYSTPVLLGEVVDNQVGVAGFLDDLNPAAGVVTVEVTTPGAAAPGQHEFVVVGPGSTVIYAVDATVIAGAVFQPVVTAAPALEDVAPIVNWVAPSASLGNPADYTVSVSGGPTTVADFEVTGTATSATLPLLSPGDYNVTVTPNYAVGAGVTGVASTPASLKVSSNTLIYQEIEVTRPVGNLVLTQRCGVYGYLPQYDATAAFPKTLLEADPVAGVLGTANAPLVRDDADYSDDVIDTLFGQYPYPVDLNGNSIATYPTECGVDMGTATLVTDDTNGGAGEFFVAHGRLNQVTVVDTRDDDLGWTATGDVEDFTVDGGDTFSGDYLGWIPERTDDSDVIDILPAGALPADTYDQDVIAGSPVAPGTLNGLTNDATLAFAPATAGLGLTILDARLLLKIPVQYDADTYNATLEISVVTV